MLLSTYLYRLMDWKLVHRLSPTAPVTPLARWYAGYMETSNTEAAIRSAIADGIRKKREYFARYRQKNRAVFRKRGREFAAAKRARSIPFSAYGYFDPKTQTIEINDIAFGAKKKTV